MTIRDQNLPPQVVSRTCPSADFHANFAAMREENRLNQMAGVAALTRLLTIAHGHSHQPKYAPHFLLCLYNGYRFKFDLTDFRSVDAEIFNDCMQVLKMDRTPMQEVHNYFENGGEIFEKLASDWGFIDHLKARAA